MIKRVGSIRTCCLPLPFTAETPLLTPSLIPFVCRLRRRFTTSCSATVTSKKTTNSNKKEKVIVISGPTGAGKSRLALELAKRLNGEIVSADSVQVYRGLDVGSAKPSLSEQKEVAHHLIDILHPSEEYSAGQFFDDGRQATKDILNRGCVPIITGGTGLYLRWFIYGKPDVPKATPEVIAEVHTELADLERNYDWDAAVQLVVKAGDPSAQSLAANDWYRLRRRLEIIKSSGSPPSDFAVPYDSFRAQLDSHAKDSSLDIKSSTDAIQEDKEKDLDYDFMCFFLSSQRLDLYKSIDLRCEDMLSGSDGLLSEASWLLELGLLPNFNSATRAIGYRQAMEYLLHCKAQGGGSSTYDFYAFLSQFQKASRNFARRQLTWFRNEHIYNWIDASRPLEEVLSFLYNAYNDQTGNVKVPKSLRMERDVLNHREYKEMKAYRPKNRHFTRREDCTDILNWISKTQGQTADSVS